jgi:hypothetical protein
MPSIAESRAVAQEKLASGQWKYVEPVAPPPAIPAPITAYPAAPNQYLRAPLPADMWEQPDGQRQFHAAAIPQTRISPLPDTANPVAGALAASAALQVVQNTPPATGGVASVALTMPGIFVAPVAGSPITSAGTLAVSLAPETQNFVFAGPTSAQGTVALDTAVGKTFGKVNVIGQNFTVNPSTVATEGQGCHIGVR